MTGTVRVSWDGRAVPGLTSMTPVARSTQVIEVHDGGTGQTSTLPGTTSSAAVRLERPVDGDLVFDTWARASGLRRNVAVELVDEQDAVRAAYRLTGCWVSAYDVAPVVATGEATEALTLAVGGWLRMAPAIGVVAEQIARERSAQVRHLDLSSLRSGSAAETEKSLTRALEAADASGAVLLLDEADALLGRRTSVEGAHGRFDDEERARLLDRIAAFPGTVLVAEPDPS